MSDTIWNVSFANVSMLLATIPTYDADTEKKTEKKEVKEELIDDFTALKELEDL